jgi:two-component system phosphate regulon sensor histidine kinase PhoR
MSSLIEDLLSLSKIEMSVDTLPEGKVAVNTILREIKTALMLRAKERQVKITTKFGRLPQITADEHQIAQVLQNLLDNAVKYAPENSEVRIELKTVPEIPSKAGQNVAPGRAVSIAFNNKGQKINKEDLARLTEKFYRMQIHKDMKIKGTGLGLAIAKQVVLHHRGNLTVTSTTYKGNTFTVYLPTKQK